MITPVIEVEADLGELRKRVLSLSPVNRNEILLDLVVSLRPPGVSGVELGRMLSASSTEIASGSRPTHSLDEVMAKLEAEFGEIPE